MPLVDDMGNLMGLCWWNMASASVGSWKTAIYCTLGAHAVGALVGIRLYPFWKQPTLSLLQLEHSWHESEKTHYGAEGMRWHPCVLVYVCVSVSMLCPGVCVCLYPCVNAILTPLLTLAWGCWLLIAPVPAYFFPDGTSGWIQTLPPWTNGVLP